jgi:hypothetical protein
MRVRWLAFVGLLVWPGLAHAQAQSEADTLFAQGRELLEKGQFAEACPKLARSEKLAPAIGTLLNLGYCYEQIGRFRSSMDSYAEAEVLASKSNDTKRATFAKERLAAVEAKVLKVVVRVVPPEAPGLEVRRNGNVLLKTDYGQAIPLDPDEVEVTATAPGRVPWKTVVMSRGEGAVVTVFVPPLVEAKSDGTAKPAESRGLGTRRIAGLGLAGASLLAIGGGVGLALAAKSRYDDSKSGCDDTGCDPHAIDVQRSAVTQGNVATALIGLGILFAGAGAYLWFFGGDSSTSGQALGGRF